MSVPDRGHRAGELAEGKWGTDEIPWVLRVRSMAYKSKPRGNQMIHGKSDTSIVPGKPGSGTGGGKGWWQ